MDGLEEIQKIINNFIDESKQAKQKISQIENERNILAQNRNQKKDANSNEYEAEINMLGKQIAELGNQSQELQNKLDAKYIDVKKVVNLMVDLAVRQQSPVTVGLQRPFTDPQFLAHVRPVHPVHLPGRAVTGAKFLHVP